MLNLKKLITLLIAIAAAICLQAGAGVVSDNFEASHNYLTNGVAGTIWDGFFYNGGADGTQNCVVTEAAATGGSLKLVTQNGNWDVAQDDGALLYINVDGDFSAEVYIKNANVINWHDMGLMARVANDADAGAGRDYVSIRYFAAQQYNGIRSTDNSVSPASIHYNAGNPHPYLKLERSGNVFSLYTKPGAADSWTLMESVVRDDMAGLPLQVGIWQATFSSNTGTVEFDNFSLTVPGYATNPSPVNKDSRTSIATNLSWNAPKGYTPIGYNVYFSQDPNNLTPLAENLAETTIDPVDGNLANNTTYYWRVDALEPNDPTPTINAGPIWSFTTEEATPYITEDPEDQVVAPDDMIALEIISQNATQFTWYYSTDTEFGDDITVGNDSSIQIPMTGIAREGWYYCVAENTVGSATSAMARVMMQRLVGWWPLDGNLNDTVDTVVPGAPRHNGQASDPNYTEGINGTTGYQFMGDGRVVTITDSAEYFNFYPIGMTVSCWAKIPVSSGWDVLLSKQHDRELGYQQGKGFYLARTDLSSSAFGIRPAEAIVMQSNLDDSWRQLTGVHDPAAGVVRVYVDGQLAGQKAANPVQFNAPNLAPLIFGAESTDGTVWPSQATIDDVKIWNYALDSWAIAQEYVDVMGGSICVEQPTLDLTGDCRIDLNDLAIFIDSWLQSGLVE